jgi:hypothetical protein
MFTRLGKANDNDIIIIKKKNKVQSGLDNSYVGYTCNAHRGWCNLDMGWHV